MKEADVIIIGSGVAGLTAAVVAGKAGLKVLVLEKADVYGGTTAYSGGAAWIPCNHHMVTVGLKDDRDRAQTYIRTCLGDLYDDDKVTAFLDAAPRMLKYMEQYSEVRFKPTIMPDYLPDEAGAAAGRTLAPVEYDGTRLGSFLRELRPPLGELMLFGSMQIEGGDVHRLRKPFSSLGAFKHSALLFSKFISQKLCYGRGTRLTNGNALVARLLRTALDTEQITLWKNASAVELLTEAGAVHGVVVDKDGQKITVSASGVILASGGFGANQEMLGRFVPMAEHHRSMQPESNTGDGIRLGQSAGGTLNENNPANCIWVPTSVLRRADGSERTFPHLRFDRYMPGAIAVDPSGRRFVDENASYQVFVNTMHERGLNRAYLIADHRFLRSYGLGLARPAPFPYRYLVENGYLIEAPTLAELAQRIGAEPLVLEATVSDFNRYARDGIDPDFGSGGNAYSRFTGDPDNTPNPALGTCERGPFYAVAVQPGSLSTLCGLETDARARVLDASGEPIAGLYAVGADMNSLFRGLYIGGGGSIGPGMTFAYLAAQDLIKRESTSATAATALKPEEYLA